MDMKIVALCGLIGSLSLSSYSYAGHDYRPAHKYHDYARVTSVEPVYRTVRINRPERECWEEERVVRHDYGSDQAAGGLVGGILGGVAGHQVGNGHGKTAATIVGTILGSKIGRDLAGRDPQRVESHVENETVCRRVNRYEEEQRLQGYQVSYRYQGREYDTFMKHHPGKRIKVRVKLVVDE